MPTLSTLARNLWMLVVLLLLAASSIQAESEDTTSTPDPLTRHELPQANFQESKPIPYTPNFAAENVSAWSKVTLQSYRNGNWDVIIGNSNGTGQYRVTNHGGSDIHPELNRGGNKLAYASYRNGDYEIYTMNLSNGNHVPLTANDADDGNPTWSPDGSKILFESYRDGQADIYVMNANGSGVQRLTSNREYDGMPAWSPDGQTIAFVSKRSGGFRIHLMNADGSNIRQLTTYRTSFRPHFSPDGQKIAFDADTDNDGWQELWTMNIDGTNIRKQIHKAGNIDTWASGWSPDGKYVTYTEIKFVFIQGNWYWEGAYAEAIPISGGSLLSLSSETVEWHPSWTTTDNVPPNSSISGLAQQSPSTFRVNWGGNDSGGAGLLHYNVQVKVGSNGSWTNWLSDTTGTTAEYTGLGGKTYFFRSQAVDQAYNHEPWSSFDGKTTVESLPPESFFSMNPQFEKNNGPFEVRWGGEDPGQSGILNYDVRYRKNGGSWVNWFVDSTQTSAFFDDFADEDVIDFQVRALDLAQNQESWDGVDNTVYIYRWSIQGQVFDNSHTPVGDATVNTSTDKVFDLNSDAFGYYGAFTQANQAVVDVSWEKDGYGSTVETPFSTVHDQSYISILPPADNIIVNSDFEAGNPLSNWQLSGDVLPTHHTDASHSGENGIRINNASNVSPLSQVISEDAWVTLARVVTTPDGVVHFFWQGSGSKFYYAFLKEDGTVSQPQKVTEGNYWPAKFLADPLGNLHIIMPVNSDSGGIQIHYFRKDVNASTFSSLEQPTSGTLRHWRLDAATDSKGNFHVVYKFSPSSNSLSSVIYLKRSANGQWSEPIDFGTTRGPADAQISIDPLDNIHLAWDYDTSSVSPTYQKVVSNINGSWTQPTVIYQVGDINSKGPPKIVSNKYGEAFLVWQYHTHYYVSAMDKEGGWGPPFEIGEAHNGRGVSAATSPDGSLHVVWNDSENTFYRKRLANGSWTQPELIAVTESLPRIVSDQMNVPHITWGGQKYGSDPDVEIHYTRLGTDGHWISPIKLSPLEEYLGESEIVIDAGGNPHIIWTHDNLLHYHTMTPSTESFDSSIAQTVTIPNSLSTPTLSFLYQIGGALPVNSSDVVLKLIDNGSEIVLREWHKGSIGWEHASIDLSPWQGKTVTLMFELNQVSGEAPVWMNIDEVTLGSTYPDLTVSAEGARAPFGTHTVHYLTVHNQGGAPANNIELAYTLPTGLEFINSNITPVQESPLEWNISRLEAGQSLTIEVEVKILQSADPYTDLISEAIVSTSDGDELEVLNNSAQSLTTIGTEIYLPLIRK